MIKNIKIKQYLLFSFLSILLFFATILFLIKGQFVLASGKLVHFPEKGFSYFLEILYHNLVNYMQYLFFPVAPLLIFKDDLVLSFLISQSIADFGIIQTVRHLLPHGLIELPNILLYQFLSLKFFYQWWMQKKKILFITKYFRDNQKFYLFSLFLLFIAALIEGCEWRS
ncbi:MAG: stage II sporulation protein M [Lactobacillales bacterium]|jgi:uncharacterized membrane protein SpoIIM required for sporulation|nr:stage II sporulation protein M [Lactobacillales bacterium]